VKVVHGAMAVPIDVLTEVQLFTARLLEADHD